MYGDTKTSANHIVPLKIYLGIGTALFVLTGITVAVSFVQLGGWNVVVALGLATIKASLVAMIFMHLRYDKKIYLVVVLTAILFLAIFITFTMFDTMARDQLYQIKAEPINKNAVIYGRPDTVTTAVDTVGSDGGDTVKTPNGP